jgi:hypothetical protein
MKRHNVESGLNLRLICIVNLSCTLTVQMARNGSINTRCTKNYQKNRPMCNLTARKETTNLDLLLFRHFCPTSQKQQPKERFTTQQENVPIRRRYPEQNIFVVTVFNATFRVRNMGHGHVTLLGKVNIYSYSVVLLLL